MKNTIKMLNNLDQIFFNSDQDECGMKHIENGLCILYMRKDPSDQDNYVDYRDGGFTLEDWEKYEDNPEFPLESKFMKECWVSLKEIYDNSTLQERKDFFRIAHPYGKVTDSRWMQYYK
jgi:hypothetical protein